MLTLSPMPIRFFCDHCRQMLKIGTSKMGSVVDCPRCHKPVVVPLQSVPQAEQLYQMLKKMHSEEKVVPPPASSIIPEPSTPESAWDELGGNVDDADLNRWIDELWKTNPAASPQDSFSQLALAPLSMPTSTSDEEVTLLALQKQHKFTVTLLYVSSAIALFVGIILGIAIHAFFVPSNHFYLQHMAGHSVGASEVTGTLLYRNENGDSWPDVDAVILCLPMEQQVAQLLSWQGLRPNDTVNHDTVQRIQEMGGMYARADVNGSFTLQYREGIQYFVILISANQKRVSEIKPSVLRELARHFRNPDQFGESCLFTDKYEWHGGTQSLGRHTFEIGD